MNNRLASLFILAVLPACSSDSVTTGTQKTTVECGKLTTDYSILLHCHENGGTVATCSDYMPTTNGCGPQASWAGYAAAQVVQGPFPFSTCCDAHDRAYGTCEGGDDLATGKTSADDALYACMLDRCDGSYPFAIGAGIWRACCRAAALIIYEAVDATQPAETAYETGQEHACSCVMAKDMAMSSPSPMPMPMSQPMSLQHVHPALPATGAISDMGTASCSGDPFTCDQVWQFVNAQDGGVASPDGGVASSDAGVARPDAGH